MRNRVPQEPPDTGETGATKAGLYVTLQNYFYSVIRSSFTAVGFDEIRLKQIQQIIIVNFHIEASEKDQYPHDVNLLVT